VHLVACFVGMFIVGQLALGLAFMFGFMSMFGLGFNLGWGLCWGLGSCSVHGRIWDGHRGYGAHGHARKCGSHAINTDLLGVLVSLQEGKWGIAYLKSCPPSLLLLLT